ncbi:hypothetical protein [Chitinophaga sp. MD30]|uniref:hypothetical protein n=1 Tax=Chitinophaga sp. MD30 TaxID=2033437 RepID=UPI001E5AC029|nr:hypothetical protein [Chitinophaga sp. MD30]
MTTLGVGIAPSWLIGKGGETPVSLKEPLTILKRLKLKNVRLETGFEYDGEEVIATKTDLFTVEIVDGKFAAILPNAPSASAVDAKGLLMLPSFRDMHIHLDKTFYGGSWQAVRKEREA